MVVMTEFRRTSLREHTMQRCEALGVVKYGDFTLASGRKSDYYINMKDGITDTQLLKWYAELAEDRIQQGPLPYDRIVGIELAAVPLAAVLSTRTDIPYLIMRKERKDHGTGKLIEGKYNSGERVLFVEDVATTGGSVLKGIKEARTVDLLANDVLVWVDREEGAKEALATEGVNLTSLFTATEMKEYHKKAEGRQVA